jgi:transcription elongation factor
VANVDRKFRDREFARFVVIKEGPNKGLKAKVLYADDKIAKLEVVSTDQKLVVEKSKVEPLDNPAQPIPFKD